MPEIYKNICSTGLLDILHNQLGTVVHLSRLRLSNFKTYTLIIGDTKTKQKKAKRSKEIKKYQGGLPLVFFFLNAPLKQERRMAST